MSLIPIDDTSWFPPIPPIVIKPTDFYGPGNYFILEGIRIDEASVRDSMESLRIGFIQSQSNSLMATFVNHRYEEVLIREYFSKEVLQWKFFPNPSPKPLYTHSYGVSCVLNFRSIDNREVLPIKYYMPSLKKDVFLLLKIWRNSKFMFADIFDKKSYAIIDIERDLSTGVFVKGTFTMITPDPNSPRPSIEDMWKPR